MNPMPTATRTRKPRKTVAKTKKVELVIPSNPRPDTLLKFEDYRKDFEIRLQIHNYEVDALLKDIQKGIDLITPYFTKAQNYVKAVYNQYSA